MTLKTVEMLIRPIGQILNCYQMPFFIISSFCLTGQTVTLVFFGLNGQESLILYLPVQPQTVS